MSQNRSSAVMQQRAEPHDSLDFFPTPPWATRALCEHVLGGKARLSVRSVWEPACGMGHMARPLAEYFGEVEASDIHPYGFGALDDFLFVLKPIDPPHWIITNPPFRLAAQFIEHAREIAAAGVAMLVRTAFLEGVQRYRELFSQTPPSVIAQFCERVPMVKGRLSQEATTATAYCWLVWHQWTPSQGTNFIWIPPSRKQLERPEDYAAGVE